MPEAIRTDSRVLIALDTATLSARVLEVGAGLAAALGARLEGLFVEDSSLMHLGGLPFAREISAVTGAWRALATEEIERALRIEAARLERLIAQAAEHARVPWSFETARGRLLAQAVAREAELTILGPSSRVAGVTRAPAAQAHVPRSLAVFFDASPASFQALEVAERLAATLRGELQLLIPTGPATEAARARAQAWLASTGHTGPAITLGAEQGALAEALRASRSELLVRALPDLRQSAQVLAELVAEVRCPLLVVRGESTLSTSGRPRKSRH